MYKTVEWRLTIPTMVTSIRLLLVPWIIGALTAHEWGVALFLFITAALTDVLDGFLARMLGEQTALGSYLDPLADKLLMVASFFTLAHCSTPMIRVPAWFCWLLLIRELILIIGGICSATGAVRPTYFGKMTTLGETLLCSIILYALWTHTPISPPLVELLFTLVGGCALLSLAHYIQLSRNKIFLTMMMVLLGSGRLSYSVEPRPSQRLADVLERVAQTSAHIVKEVGGLQLELLQRCSDVSSYDKGKKERAARAEKLEKLCTRLEDSLTIIEDIGELIKK